MKLNIPPVDIDIINKEEFHQVKEDYNGFYDPPDTIVLWYNKDKINKEKEIIDCCDEYLTNDLITEIINTINHEYMHHILYHLEGNKASDDFDNLFMYVSIEYDNSFHKEGRGGDE